MTDPTHSKTGPERLSTSSGEPEPRPTSGRKAVIYVTTPAFLYPTIVSAMQVEQQIETDLVDLIVFLNDVSDRDLKLATAATAGRRIRFDVLDSSLFALPAGVEMLPSHVPPASLARLVIDQVLDPIYESVLYLDGDTLVTGDIRPLLAFEPPRETIGAVRGSVWLGRAEGRRDPSSVDTYVQGLGLRHPDSYFNAGVLSLRRADLHNFGAAAFDYFLRHPSRCRFHDQSALNHVFDGKVTELWPGFNYHVPYQELLSVKLAQPSIVHFTGPLKPWIHRNGRFAPFARIYDRFDVDHPEAARLRVQADATTRVEVRWKGLRSAIRQCLSPGQWVRRRRHLKRYLASFDVAGGKSHAVQTTAQPSV